MDIQHLRLLNKDPLLTSEPEACQISVYLPIPIVVRYSLNLNMPPSEMLGQYAFSVFKDPLVVRWPSNTAKPV